MENGFIQSKGIFKYGPGNRAVLLVDQGIADFYRAMIPKWIYAAKQLYPAHISVVRRQIPPKMEFWGKYEGQEIDFEYQPIVENDESYFWLNVRCKRLEEIREELGLNPFPPWRNLYHITVGNCKRPPSEVVGEYFKFTKGYHEQINN